MASSDVAGELERPRVDLVRGESSLNDCACCGCGCAGGAGDIGTGCAPGGGGGGGPELPIGASSCGGGREGGFSNL